MPAAASPPLPRPLVAALVVLHALPLFLFGAALLPDPEVRSYFSSSTRMLVIVTLSVSVAWMLYAMTLAPMASNAANARAPLLRPGIPEDSKQGTSVSRAGPGQAEGPTASTRLPGSFRAAPALCMDAAFDAPGKACPRDDRTHHEPLDSAVAAARLVRDPGRREVQRRMLAESRTARQTDEERADRRCPGPTRPGPR